MSSRELAPSGVIDLTDDTEEHMDPFFAHFLGLSDAAKAQIGISDFEIRRAAEKYSADDKEQSMAIMPQPVQFFKLPRWCKVHDHEQPTRAVGWTASGSPTCNRNGKCVAIPETPQDKASNMKGMEGSMKKKRRLGTRLFG